MPPPVANENPAPATAPRLTSPEQPLISVVMPVHNTAAHLAQAISSIQAQTYRRWELIIVDDSSSDGSAALAQRHAAHDDRIRTFTVEHGGVAAALNAGIAAAGGELIARMDADDIAAPERFAVQLDWMQRTGVEVCGSWAVWFGEEEGAWWVPETHEGIALHLAINPSMVHPTVLMHTAIARANPYREDFACEDFELWTRLIDRHRMGNVPAVLLRYRRHSDQASKRHAARIRVDAGVCRRRGFDAVFPGADPALLAAFDRMHTFQCCADLEELELVGGMLVRLAQSPEEALRRRMLRRWRETCRCSARLGRRVYGTYMGTAQEFAVPYGPDRPLEVACAMRMPRSLRLESQLWRLARVTGLRP